MRINFLLPHYGYRPTGGFAVVYAYANQFVKRGHDVRLIYAAACKKGVRKLFGWVRTYRGRKNASDWFELLSGIEQIYVPGLEEKYIPDADVTVATAYETVLFLKDYSESKGEKVYFIQDLEVWADKEEKVLETWRLPLKKIVISQFLVAKGREEGISDLVQIPNAINHEEYRIYEDWHKREKTVVMMYSNAERKGSVYGIRALLDLKKMMSDVKIILFGKVKRPEDLPQWIEYYENPQRDFLVKEIYNKAMILLCSSIYEGWGLPVMEGMACGCAVVTTDCGGVRDLAIPNKTAMVCPVKDIDAMKSAMYELLIKDDLREQLVVNALQKVQEYDWDKSADLFLDNIS